MPLTFFGIAAALTMRILTGAWIFAVLESVWTVLAINRLRAAGAADPLVDSKSSR